MRVIEAEPYWETRVGFQVFVGILFQNICAARSHMVVKSLGAKDVPCHEGIRIGI